MDNSAGNRFSRTDRLLLLGVCLGAFISHLTAGIVNIALPGLTRIFGAGLDAVQWITTGYLLVIVALLPLMGKLGDRFGLRKIHNTGVVLFAAASILTAFSSDLGYLLVFRLVQAVGSSMFQATNIALITKFLPPSQRGKALGILGTATALGAMFGPPVGGWIAQWLDWHWLFLVHVPIALPAIALAYRYIPKDTVSRKAPIDLAGLILFAATVILLVYALSSGSRAGWLNPQIVLSAVCGVFFFAWFLKWEMRRKQHAFLPLSVLASPMVGIGMAISFASFMAAFSMQVVMPFYLIGVLGKLPYEAGFLMMTYPVVLAVSGPIAGNGSDRFGSERFTWLGLAGMSAAFLALALRSHHAVWEVILMLSLLGVGMGLVSSPNNSIIMKNVPLSHIGSVGGLIALSRNLGLVLGSALGLGLLQRYSGSAQNITGYRLLFGFYSAVCLALVFIFLYAQNDGMRLKRREAGTEERETNVV